MGSAVEVSLPSVLWVEGTNADPFCLCIIGRPEGGPWNFISKTMMRLLANCMQDQIWTLADNLLSSVDCMLVVFVMLAWKTMRWLLAFVYKTHGFGPRHVKEDHDTACGIMARLLLAHSTFCWLLDMYDMYGLFDKYGMWYLKNSLRFVLTVCGLWF